MPAEISASNALLEARIVLRRAIASKFPSSAEFTLDVAFSAPAGFTILFGPSGAGKSTLLDCLAGLLRPQQARIAFANETWHDSAAGLFLPPQSRRAGYLFQSPALFPHRTVAENVAFGLHAMPSPERGAAVALLLESFRVSHLAARKPREISGGEAQRVALARALAPRPGVLLLDEPLKGLDAGLRAAILEDLRAWQRANPMPILYVTHQREEADALGERLIALENGRIAATGAPHEVLDAPRTQRLASAAGFENLFSAGVLELRAPDGVMRARISATQTELELPLGPLAHTKTGDAIRFAIRAGDILLAVQAPAGISARNILQGTLRSIEARGATVVCRVDAGAEFQVHVTPGAARTLGLYPGQSVWLVIKTHSCHLLA